jgi:O-antigen/teichoic acid export membrane protein
MQVVSPVLSRSFVESGQALPRRFARAAHLMAVLAVPVAVAGAMTADRVVPVIPGFASYEGAGDALAILAPGAALIYLGTLVQGTLVSAHLQRQLLAIAAVGLVVNVVLNVALIPPFSYIGASVATTVTEGAILVMSLWVARRWAGLLWPIDRLLPLLLAAGVMALALVAGFALEPVLQLVVGLVAYVVALPLTRALTWSDLSGVIKRDAVIVE